MTATGAAPGDLVADVAMPPAERKLGLGLSLSFGVGTVGASILLNTVSVYLPALMATVLGRSAATAGLLLTLSKLYDIVADLTIGAVSDRTVSRWGRRRPYLLAGAAISSAAFFALFAAPGLKGQDLIVYIGAVLVIYSTGYSLFNVPYVAMPAEMTNGYHERTRLLSFRTFFASIGQILALSAAAWLIRMRGGGAEGYRLMGLVLGAVVLVTSLITFFGTARAAQTQRTQVPHLSSLRQIGLIASNGPLLKLMGTKFLQFLSLATTTSTGLLFRLNVLKIGYGGQAELALVQNIVTAASMPLWLWIGRRIGKKWAYVLSIVINGAGQLSWLMAGPGDSRLSIDVRAAVMGVGVGGMLLMSIAMLPDVMEYDYLRTGLRREGIFSSFYAIIEKVGFAIGPGIAGVILAQAGYVSTMHGKLVTQPPSAIHALYVVNSIVPAVLLLGSLLLISTYGVSEKTLRRMGG